MIRVTLPMGLMSLVVCVANLTPSPTVAASMSEAGPPTDFDGNRIERRTSHQVERPANGAPALHGGEGQVFNDQAAFLAAAGPVSNETFEDEASSALCDGFGTTARAMDEFSATSDPAALKLLRENCFGNHNTTPGGERYLSADTDIGDVSAEVTFVFNEPISSLGFFLIDLDIATLEVTINGASYQIPPNGDGGQSYFGIVGALPFTTATFRIVESDSHYSFDDVAYGSAGPVSAPQVTYLRSTQRPGTHLVDVTYRVQDADSPLVTLSLALSADNGATFPVPCSAISWWYGDGPSVDPDGSFRGLTWNAGADLPSSSGTYYLRLTADDGANAAVPIRLPALSAADGGRPR